MGMRLTQDEIADIKRMRSEGKSTHEIAEWIGCSDFPVRKYAPLHAHHLLWTPEEEETLLRLIQSGKTYREIGAILNRSKGSVGNHVCEMRKWRGIDEVRLVKRGRRPTTLRAFTCEKIGVSQYNVTWHKKTRGMYIVARVTDTALIDKTFLCDTPKTEDICALSYYVEDHGTMYFKKKKQTSTTMNVTCIKGLERGNALFVRGQDYEAHFLPHTFGQVKVMDADGNSVCLRDPQFAKHFE